MRTRTIGYKWYRFIFYFNSENIPYRLELLNDTQFIGEIDLLNDRYATTIGLTDLLRRSQEDIEKKLNKVIGKKNNTHNLSNNSGEENIMNHEYSEKMQSFFEYVLKEFILESKS